MFVLDRLMQHETLPRRSVLSSLGPGFTASAVSLLNEAA